MITSWFFQNKSHYKRNPWKFQEVDHGSNRVKINEISHKVWSLFSQGGNTPTSLFKNH